jgi:hypothetical protein
VVRDAILSVMKTPAGVASSHDIAVRRGGLPQRKKFNFIGSPTFRLRRIALHQLEHEQFANQAL